MDAVGLGAAVIMGIVEGLTEFIPVSSTGHLIVAGHALGFAAIMGDEGAAKAFEVVIQLGAILAVCWLYRARLIQIARELPTTWNAQRFVLALFVAFLPAAVVGLAANKWVDAHLFTPGVVAVALALGGGAIIAVERWPRTVRHLDVGALPWAVIIGIGLFQCLAVLLPGTSRSAATIIGAMLLGVDRRVATEFSFFLAMPIMFAASGYKLVQHHAAFTGDRLVLLAVGFAVSFLVAWVVVAWLLRFVAANRFTAFGWYRLAAGAVIAGLIALGWLR